MICYASLGSNDLARSAAFYNPVLSHLGLYPEVLPTVVFYARAGGDEEEIVLAITLPYDGERASVGNGTMIALHADSEAMVDVVYATAIAQGGVSEGAPGTRPAYGPRRYLAYFRDPDGNKLSIVYLKPAE
ncbi:MAG: VOC family protein [Burkholderiaceae bacterium]|nr:VOC family protein [Burkholderiaceae bacterium]